MERLLNLDHDSTSMMATDCLTIMLSRFTVETKDVLEAGSPGLESFVKALKPKEVIRKENILVQKEAIKQVIKAIPLSETFLMRGYNV